MLVHKECVDKYLPETETIMVIFLPKLIPKLIWHPLWHFKIYEANDLEFDSFEEMAEGI